MTDWILTWTTVLAISTSVMALAIVITAIFALVQWLHYKKARYSALLMQIIEMWNSTDYVVARNMIARHACGENEEDIANNFRESMLALDNGNSQDYLIMIKVANFFENLGFLTCKKDYLTPEDALDLFGGAARYYWGIFRALAIYDRTERKPKRTDVWIYFEKLASEALKKQGT
jgi:hypothetical protein